MQEHFQQLAQTTLGKVIAAASPYERLCLMAVIRATRTRGGDDCSCTVSDVALEMITMGADIPDDVPTVVSSCNVFMNERIMCSKHMNVCMQHCVDWRVRILSTLIARQRSTQSEK